MKNRSHCAFIKFMQISIFVLVSLSALWAGTTGSIVGVLKDAESGEALPGAVITIQGTQLGTQTQEDGTFFFHNLPAGTYSIHISLLGYEEKIIEGIAVSPDKKTHLEIALSSKAIPGEKVVVEASMPVVRKDITASQYVVEQKQLQVLPVTEISQVMETRAGVTEGGHIRGGRTEEVIYLIDGVPLNQTISGGLGAFIPLEAIAEMTVMTGGWDPEFGNASSGVVNIVTRHGDNRRRLDVKYENDHLFGGNRHNQYHRLAANFSGPLMGDRLTYFASLAYQQDNTRFWWDFDDAVERPLHRLTSGLVNLSYRYRAGIRLGSQFLFSDEELQPYDFAWRYNLSGLPRQFRRSFRWVLNYSHNFDSRTFLDTRLSWYRINDRINPLSREEVQHQELYQYDVFLLYVIRGNRLWWKRAQENIFTLQSTLTTYRILNQYWRLGFEFNYYDIRQDLLKLEPQRTLWGKPLTEEPPLNYSNNFHYQPYGGALFLQTKWETPKKSLVNLGVRYDFLNPRARKPNIFVPSQQFEFSEDYITWQPASIKQQISPRVGFGMPVMENSFLFINYGMFFQTPLFEYFYSGLHSDFQFSQRALIGNPDLPPMVSRIFELSYRHAIKEDYAVTVTAAVKKTSNLVDVNTFVGYDSKADKNRGYGQFVNLPYAEANSFEVVLKKRPGGWFWGELNYTYAIAKAASDRADANFEYLQWGFHPDADMYFVSWDQRHTINLNVNLQLRNLISGSIISRFASPRPYTYFPSRNGFVPDDPRLQLTPNNARMKNTFTTDLKVQVYLKHLVRRFQRLPGNWVLYADIRNLFNNKNVLWMSSNGEVGGELHDPAAYSEGQRIRLGMEIIF